jgi:DNA-binding CsgD family transcriptional regulator
MKKIIEKQKQLIAEQKQVITEQKKALQQKDKAIAELLQRTASDKAILEGAVVSNVNMLLIPLIIKLESKDKASKLVGALRAIIEQLTQPTLLKMYDKKLSRREVEICNLIKEGLTSREITVQLSIKPLTLEKHRYHIRKKLGIGDSGHNLYQILMGRY